MGSEINEIYKREHKGKRSFKDFLVLYNATDEFMNINGGGSHELKAVNSNYGHGLDATMQSADGTQSSGEQTIVQLGCNHTNNILVFGVGFAIAALAVTIILKRKAE